MLSRSSMFPGVAGPVVTVVMDGIGQRGATAGNAVADAHTPTLDRLFARYPHTLLKAHGTAVGMPSDEDMGNSEVGHNALGSGQVYAQGAALVNDAIASGSLFAGAAWGEIVANVLASGGTLHLLGLFSDGNVHSHIEHLKALVMAARGAGVGRVRIHALLDGRDVPATSALDYVLPFEQFLAGLGSDAFDARIASGGGRMYITMDRYEADWDMVARGWATHVVGEGRRFASAAEAIATLRGEKPGIGDQDLPAFVIATEGAPLGPIVDGDSVVFFNFRGDRAIEISRAFTEEVFTPFARGRLPRVCYAGMLQYDGDLQIPRRFLVAPPAIRDTMGEYLSSAGVSQFAISETQKFGHVTYFWNGNRSEKFSETLETWEEVPSDIVPFDQRPWMKSAEVTDKVIEAIESKKYGFIRCNYPNGDMVGHTGNMDTTIIGVEAVDLALARLIPVVEKENAILVVTADHGNADEMLEKNKKGVVSVRTAHSLNPVPFIIFNADVEIADGKFGLSNVAATVAKLMGFAPDPHWDAPIIK